MAATPEAIAGGQRVGRYELIRRLAVGGMAEIYLSRVPGVGIEGFEKLVVLKQILPQHALDPELLRMFVDEARLTATLTHPHVTAVYDVGTSGDAPFFTMEFVHGANLRQIMRAGQQQGSLTPITSFAGIGAPSQSPPERGEAPRPKSELHALPLEHAIAIVAAAASGLHYAHEKTGPGGEPLNIVHRDVSPSNVLVSYDGGVKVSDFGIAKWAFQRTQTQEGALKGKFAYMSPEQCRGQPLDRRSDVFALGTILYELTTGRTPFPAETDFEILNAIVSGTPRPPTWPAGEREYPAALSEIVLRALARDPADRYPTAQALQVDLEGFARAERLEVSTVALGTFMQTLFADELAAWREAQRAGKSLGEHLAEGAAGGPAPADGPTATDAFAATRPAVRLRRRKRALAAAVVLGALTAGGVMAGSRARMWAAGAARGGAASSTTAAPVATDTAPVALVPAATPAVAPAPQPAPERSTAEKQENNVEAHPAPSSPPASRPAVKRGARARAAAAAAAPASGEHSLESKLGKWDPDSPVPP
jgi:serine/threonine protein kinase